MTLTRRAFLSLFGVTVLNIPLVQVIHPSGVESSQLAEVIAGRVLQPTPLVIAPGHSETIQTLWADEIINIAGLEGDWYRVGSGFAQVSDIQPIRPVLATSAEIELPLPVVAQVGGPVAVVRAYCDLHAPTITRIGHGGVMSIVDMITYPKTGGWVQLASANGETLGWAQQAGWRPLTDEAHDQPLNLTLQRASRQMRIGEAFTTPVNMPSTLPAGKFALKRGPVGGVQLMRNGASQHGVPYNFSFGEGHTLHGVTWHNTFGSEAPSVEMNVLAAATIWRARDIHLTIT